MPTSRADYRYRVELRGWVHAGPASTIPEPARVIDLSRTGVCLRFEADTSSRSEMLVGKSILLALDEAIDGARVAGRWLGRVAHTSRLGDGGLRVGLAFDGGRTLTLPPGLAERLIAPSSPALPARTSPDALVLAAIGLTLDQASKAWAWSPSPNLDAVAELVPGLLSVVPAANDGALANLAGGSPWTSTLCALASLTLAAMTPRWAPNGGGSSIGAGLLAAGLVGNAGDRLALGFVRDFLTSPQIPQWSFNLADLFLLLGAVAMLTPRRTTS
ncbi:MAG: signal peptidase II [Isosphaeraceae bacterium]